jgi:hypothetical protein
LLLSIITNLFPFSLLFQSGDDGDAQHSALKELVKGVLVDFRKVAINNNGDSIATAVTNSETCTPLKSLKDRVQQMDDEGNTEEDDDGDEDDPTLENGLPSHEDDKIFENVAPSQERNKSPIGGKGEPDLHTAPAGVLIVPVENESSPGVLHETQAPAVLRKKLRRSSIVRDFLYTMEDTIIRKTHEEEGDSSDDGDDDDDSDVFDGAVANEYDNRQPRAMPLGETRIDERSLQWADKIISFVLKKRLRAGFDSFKNFTQDARISTLQPPSKVSGIGVINQDAERDEYLGVIPENAETEDIEPRLSDRENKQHYLPELPTRAIQDAVVEGTTVEVEKKVKRQPETMPLEVPISIKTIEKKNATKEQMVTTPLQGIICPPIMPGLDFEEDKGPLEPSAQVAFDDNQNHLTEMLSLASTKRSTSHGVDDLLPQQRQTVNAVSQEQMCHPPPVDASETTKARKRSEPGPWEQTPKQSALRSLQADVACITGCNLLTISEAAILTSRLSSGSILVVMMLSVMHFLRFSTHVCVFLPTKHTKSIAHLLSPYLIKATAAKVPTRPVEKKRPQMVPLHDESLKWESPSKTSGENQFQYIQDASWIHFLSQLSSKSTTGKHLTSPVERKRSQMLPLQPKESLSRNSDEKSRFQYQRDFPTEELKASWTVFISQREGEVTFDSNTIWPIYVVLARLYHFLFLYCCILLLHSFMIPFLVVFFFNVAAACRVCGTFSSCRSAFDAAPIFLFPVDATLVTLTTKRSAFFCF